MSKKLNTEPMSSEPNKPIAARELTEKELEGIVGGATLEDMLVRKVLGLEKMVPVGDVTVQN